MASRLEKVTAFGLTIRPLFASAALIHGADERIDVRDLALATDFFRALAVRVLS